MKNPSVKKFFIPAILVVVAAFNIILFLLKHCNFTTTFWFTYGFIMFAFFMVILVSLFAKEKETGVAYIHPTVTVTFIYLFVVFIFGLVMIFFPKAPLVLVLIPMIILTALFLVIYILASINKAIVKREDQPKSKMFKMNDVPDVLTSIISQTGDATLKRQLEELKTMAINAAGYTEPGMETFDERIFGYIQFIEKNVRRNEMDNVYNNVKKVKELFVEREKRIQNQNQ